MNVVCAYVLNGLNYSRKTMHKSANNMLKVFCFWQSPGFHQQAVQALIHLNSLVTPAKINYGKNSSHLRTFAWPLQTSVRKTKLG
jgi:hypothetical protein